MRSSARQSEFLDRVNRAELGGQFPPTFLKIIKVLKVKPEFRGNRKKLTELERGLCSDGALGSYDLTNMGLREASFFGKAVGRYLHRLKKLRLEYISGMNVA